MIAAKGEKTAGNEAITAWLGNVGAALSHSKSSGIHKLYMSLS